MTVRFRPRPGSPVVLSAEQVVDWFLDVHAWWFIDPANNLHGGRDICRMILLLYLNTGKKPPHPDSKVGYVLNKFREEAEGWFEREDHSPAQPRGGLSTGAIPLSAGLRRLAGEFLRQYAEVLGNRICNDWSWPDHLDQEERWILAGDAERLMDWQVADRLAYLIGGDPGPG